MERRESSHAARGLTDSRDRLLTADEALAQLQENCGGTLPGALAIPELLDLVRQGRSMGLRIAREFSAYDGGDLVSGFARIHPLDHDEGGGCEILIDNWQRVPATLGTSRENAARIDAIDRAAAEISARLDARQHVQLMTSESVDANKLLAEVSANPSRVWTDYVQLRGVAHHQPLHWRLLDGAECEVGGSGRKWRVRLFPIGPANGAPRGFELLLIADQPLLSEDSTERDGASHVNLIGSAMTPVLRKPVARIIANADTIRARLAGPLRAEYSEYAGNIIAAGQHLSAMLDDLADLEVVEAEGFKTARERVDLGDVAKRAVGIVQGKAQVRSIAIEAPEAGSGPVATAEFRRVLQVLINLLGNAIAYSPEESRITITTATDDAGSVSIAVRDQGPGIAPDQIGKVFDKFERLGRDGAGGADKGSGLGLYISRRLAKAMGGELSLESEEGAGATFTLTLPAAD